jgi:hypothetical protein
VITFASNNSGLVESDQGEIERNATVEREEKPRALSSPPSMELISVALI